jgi:hypothetical protein
MANDRQGSFRWIYAAGAALLILITTFAIAFAIQEHNYRVLSEEITETSSELQDVGERITAIRDADLKDMNDYVRAYSEMAPLLNDYDRNLQRITYLYNEARQRDKRVFNVARLYRKPHVTNWERMSEILDITRALGTVMREESSVIHNMAELPQSDQMQFWHEHYLPLEAQEKGLRAKLLVVGQRMTPAEQ